jgi:hypothetical protein
MTGLSNKLPVSRRFPLTINTTDFEIVPLLAEVYEVYFAVPGANAIRKPLTRKGHEKAGRSF